jgi:hypothetical protein
MVEGCDSQHQAASVRAQAGLDGKKPYCKPELTKHEPLTEITLGVYCTSGPPACPSILIYFQ